MSFSSGLWLGVSVLFLIFTQGFNNYKINDLQENTNATTSSTLKQPMQEDEPNVQFQSFSLPDPHRHNTNKSVGFPKAGIEFHTNEGIYDALEKVFTFFGLQQWLPRQVVVTTSSSFFLWRAPPLVLLH